MTDWMKRINTTCTYLQYCMIIKHPVSVNVHIATIAIPKPTLSPISTVLSPDAVNSVSCVVLSVASVSN